jgi:large subunit ribosomal protein L21
MVGAFARLWVEGLRLYKGAETGLTTDGAACGCALAAIGGTCYTRGLGGISSSGLPFVEFFQEVHMYAVIKTGGKQYRVAAGEKIKVEQIAADVGQEIVFDQVLAVGNGTEIKVGTPLVSGATVTVTVLAHGRHDKVSIFKMRRRKHYQKRQGHRQNFTELQISSIAA